MKLHLSSLKVHLAWCSAMPYIGRAFGVVFTDNGVAQVANVPTFR